METVRTGMSQSEWMKVERVEGRGGSVLVVCMREKGWIFCGIEFHSAIRVGVFAGYRGRTTDWGLSCRVQGSALKTSG
jgi:hypothetical protein